MNQNSDGASRSVKAEPWIIEAQGDQEPSLSEHLVQLPGERWAMWRQVGLRGAGFPARLVLQLAVPECAATALPRELSRGGRILKHAAVLPLGSLIQQFLFCFEGNHDVHLRTAFGACGKWLPRSCWPLMKVASGNSNRRLSIAGSA